MSEYGPSNSGDYGESSSDQSSTDFELWEAELENDESIARLSLELGRLSLQGEIEYPEEEQEPSKKKKPEEPDQEKWEMPAMDESAGFSGGEYLLGDEMYGAAVGLIYLTTGFSMEDD